MLFSLARLRIPHNEDAEDVVGTVFLALAPREIDFSTPGGRFYAIKSLRRACNRAGALWIRRAQVRAPMEFGFNVESQGYAEGLAVALDLERWARSLTPRQRQIVELLATECSGVEVSRRTGIALRTVQRETAALRQSAKEGVIL